jgi:hypothetical protein
MTNSQMQDLFKIEAIPDYLSDIALFLSIGVCPDGYSATQKRHLVVCNSRLSIDCRSTI